MFEVNRQRLLTVNFLLACVAVITTSPSAFSQQGEESNSDVLRARAFLSKVRALPLATQNIRFRYSDGSDFEYEYLLQGDRWRVDTRYVAESDADSHRFIEKFSCDGNSLDLGLALPNGKKVLLTSRNLNRLPIGMSAPQNPMLLAYSWLIPGPHFTWQDAVSEKNWTTAIDKMQWVRNEKVGSRETQVFKLSHGHIVHTLWFSIADDGFPIKCQRVDLNSRSISVWEVAELTKLSNNTYLPTSLILKTDELPPRRLKIDVVSIDLTVDATMGDFRSDPNGYVVAVDVEDRKFSARFQNATDEILPVSQPKDGGATSIDFSYNIGRLHGTKDSRANDLTLEAITKWDVSTIEHVELGNNRDITDLGMRYLRSFQNMKALSLYQSGVKGPGLKHLVGMQNLTSISLQSSDFSDEGMEQLGRMPQLTWLNLAGTKITDSGLFHLDRLHLLETLDLTDATISDQSIFTLARFKNLSSLSLDRTQVSLDGIARLKKELPACNISTDFHLGRMPSTERLFTDGYVPTADEMNAKFKKLGIDGEVQVDPLNKNVIERFRVFGVSWSSDVFLQLLTSMPDLKILNTRNSMIEDTLLERLDLPKLEYLDLSGSRVTDKGLRSIGRLPKLRVVHLCETRVSEDGLKCLEDLPHLETATCNQNTVTLEGYHRLGDYLRITAVRDGRNQ